MQNYEAILSELEIEIPEDKKADLKKKMEENYRTKSDSVSYTHLTLPTILRV